MKTRNTFLHVILCTRVVPNLTEQLISDFYTIHEIMGIVAIFDNMFI